MYIINAAAAAVVIAVLFLVCIAFSLLLLHFSSYFLWLNVSVAKRNIFENAYGRTHMRAAPYTGSSCNNRTRENRNVSVAVNE